MFFRPMNGEVGDQPGLTIGDGIVLPLSNLDLQYIVGGLGLQEREGLFPFSRDNTPVFKQKITTIVADLIDVTLGCVFHRLKRAKKTHPLKWMRGGNHPETEWRGPTIIFQVK